MGDGGVEEVAVENSRDRIFELAQVFLAEALTQTHLLHHDDGSLSI